MLPIDEDHFEINANTRAIGIPNAFKKNGIAVQGDDLAEIVYFKVDRYFDYMDFNNCDIFIQWETPKGSGESVKSVSTEYIRDIESEPGKLIFGWAISDALTGASGQLKFSVRFIKWSVDAEGKKTIDYSFSTLTATVNIQPGLNYNLEDSELNVDDCGDRIIGRLENSVIVGGYQAAEPVYIIDLLPIVDLDTDVDGDGVADTYKLMVQAYANDTGAISYSWKKQVIDAEGNKGEIIILDGSNDYIAADLSNGGANLNPAYAYYQPVGDTGRWTRYKGSIPPSAEDLAKDDFELYIKTSSCVVDSVGQYCAVAENRLTNSSNSKESTICEIPYPLPVIITVEPVANGIVADDVVVTLTVAASNTDGVLTYQWYKDDNYKINFGDQAENWVAIDGATAASYDASEQGHYYCEVSNTRNKEVATENSKYARITLAAQAPVIMPVAPGAEDFDEAVLSDTNCPTIEVDVDAVDHDAYYVEWFKFDAADKPGLKIMDEPIENGFSFNPFNYLDKIKEVDPDQGIYGKYYAVVTNHLNGSSASAQSDSFDII